MPHDPDRLSAAEARILTLSVADTLTRSLLGDRLWSLRGNPFTVFDDLSPRRLHAAGFIVLAHPGSVAEDRADAYAVTPAGLAALRRHSPDTST